MGTRYQVVGECAHVVAADHTGTKATVLLYKGAYLPEGVEPGRLRHLIDSGLVAEEGEVPLAPNVAVPQDPTVGIPPVGDAASTAKAVDDVHSTLTEEERQAQREKAEAEAAAEQRRAEAKAKLKQDADGKYAAPHANAGEDVWIEYAVTQGTDRAEAEKAGKDALKALYTSKP